MTTIDADELIKALEDEHQSATEFMSEAQTKTEYQEWYNFRDGIQLAIDTVKTLVWQADNVGKLPY